MNLPTTRAALAAIAALLLACLVPHPAHADSNARDPVNAATLLFPYFEVDLTDPDGSTTIISIRDASASAALGNVTVWSDVGVPVLNFPVYFTGYDVVTFDLRAMLVDGQLPRTASDGQDPSDTISPQGPRSQDINFASCNGVLPFDPQGLLPSTIEYLQAALTGQPSVPFGGQCAGSNQGDGIARGYITVDTVNRCTSLTPDDPGYLIGGGGGDATLQNILSGEYLLRDNGGRLLHTGRAVALEASFANHATPGAYTFYGRFVGWTAADHREPLNGTWAVDTQAKGAELIVWRDTKVASPNGFACGTMPAPVPLDQTEVVNFGTNTADQAPAGTTPFALATQRVAIDASAVGGVPGKPGWSYLNLNVTLGADPADAPGSNQAYVEVIQFPEVSGQGGGSGAAMPLDTGNAPRLTPLPSPF